MAAVRNFRAFLTGVFLYTRVRACRLRVGFAVSLLTAVVLATLSVAIWAKPQTATAAAANTVNFQARLETNSGAIAQDGNYNVRFRLYNVSTGGTALWTESYLVSASQGLRTANGYLTVNLGSITAFPSSISWGQQLYLTMEIGGTGSSATWDGEMSPRLSLTSVPSAFALNTYNGATGFSSSLSILQPTGGNQVFQIQDQGAAGTYNLCVSGSASCGFATTTGGSGYIQNQSASAQTSSNFWISGTGKAATALQAPSFDSVAAGNLNIGTTNATSITLGKSGVNTIVAGSLSVGTTSSYGAITIANGAWLTALDSAGTGSINVLSVNANNEIQVGAALNIDGGIVLPTDGGQMTFSDLPISSSALAGAAQSYTLRVGSSNALTVYGEADGAGNAQNIRVAIGSSITPAYTLDVGGDINTSGTFRINGTAICTTTGCSAASGSGNYIQNTTTQQATSNFYISGTGKATTSLLTPTIDTIAAGSLAVGTGTATSITIAKAGVATTVAGTLNVSGNTTATGLITANGGLTVNGLTQLYVSTATNNASGGTTNWLRTPKNTVSAFIGDSDNTTAYTANEFSGNVRFNGSGVAWGDFGYYPQGGGNGNAGQFRFSTVGAAVNTTPNAKVGVGSLYSAGAIGIGTMSPSFSLDVQGGNINTSGGLYTAGALRVSSAGAGTLSTLSLTGVLTSTVATGTAPFTVASTTKVTNLNADLLDGLDSSAFCQGSCVAGGSASGDLTGTYPNPTIASLQGSTLTITTPVSGNILQFNGTAWVNQAVTGDISIAGTGVATITPGSIINADLATGSFTNITGVGTLGSLNVTNNVSLISGGLVVNGVTVLTNGRTLQNVTYQGGTIGVGYGGTGQTSFTQYGLLYGNNTGALGATGAGTTGQCLVAASGGAPTWGSCAGTGSGATLQAAYSNSLGGTTPEIVLDSSRTTLDVQAYSGQTADLLDLRAYAASGLGTLRFGVTAAGAVTAAGSLTVQSGGASITGGINNNSGGITNTGNVTGVTGITTTGGYTQSGATANTLTGATTISNTLTVSNTATFNGNLVVSSGTITQGGYLTADAATDNLVVNGDFERNNATGWTGVTDIVTGGYSGNYAAHFTGSATLESTDYIPVDPTQDVLQLEAYVKKSVAGTTPGTMYFGYKAYTASKTAISTAPCGSWCYFAASGTVVPVDGSWHKYSATTTGEGTVFPNFPVGTKYIRVLGLINYTGSADTETLVDHVSVRRINNGALFVGNNFSASNMRDHYQQAQLYTLTTGVLTVATQSNADMNLLNGGLQIGSTSVITAARAIQNATGLTVDGVSQLYASGALNSSTTSATNWLRSPKGTVTVFVGDTDSTSAYTANEFSGNIRFNGGGANWGDFGYYPQGGGNGNAGQFRLSLTGAAVDTTPDAKLGVGSLYVATNVGIGQLSPSYALDVTGTGRFSTGVIASGYAGVGNSFSSTSNDIYIESGAASRSIYLRPNGTGSNTGLVTINTTALTTGTLNGTTGINTGSGNGTQRIDNSGNLLNIGNATISGVYRDTTNAVWNGTTGMFAMGADQVGYLNLGDIAFSGTYTVTLNGQWASGAAFGNITRAYSFYHAAGGAAITNYESETTQAMGQIATRYALGEVEVSGTSLRIPVYQISSTSSNNLIVRVEVSTAAAGALTSAVAGLSVTAPTTVANTATRNHVSFISSNVGIGTNSPTEMLDVQGGNINTSGNLMIGGTVRIASTGAGTLDSLSVTNNVSIISGGLVVNGVTVLTNGRTLQNVTYQGGTIGVGYGGTGQTSFTQYGILFGNNTGNVGVTGAGTTGQCLVATTGGAPAWSTCAGVGSGVTLQSAYNNSLGGTTPEIVLDSSRTTLDVQAYSGQTADLLDLRAYSASGLGVLRFGVAADGAVTAAGSLTVQSGGASITGGINNNTGNITNTGSLAGVTGITTSGGYTQTGASANTFTGTITSTNAITGTTLNGTSGINTGVGAGTTRIDVTGNLVNINTATLNTLIVNDQINLNAGSASGQIAFNYSGKANANFNFYNGGSSSVALLNGTNGNFATIGSLQGTSFTSTVATGTAPLTVASTTKVANFNADLLDGLDSTAFAAASGSGSYIQNGTSPQTANFNITGNGTIGGNLIVGGSTVQLANFYPEYRWRFPDSTTDLNWKKIADITLGTGLYTAASFQVDVTDTNCNFGCTTNVIPMRFYVSAYRSSSTQDAPDTGSVAGPSTDYVRLIRTALGVYELQVRSAANYRTMDFTVRQIAGLGAVAITYASGTPINGSTVGTIYNSSVTGYTQLLPNVNATGNAYLATLSGRVGIGTTTPNYSLDIKPAAGNAALNVQNSAGSNLLTLTGSSPALVMSTNGYGIFYGASITGVRMASTADTTTSVPLVARGITGQTADLFQVRDNATNNTVLMNVIANGNVGISTTNPSQKLDVQGGSINTSANIMTAGIIRLTSTGTLQNVSMDAALITSGTLASARLSGSYTGVTTVGTLTGVTTNGVIISNVATGTAPLQVASTTLVTNLNADLLDGYHATDFALSGSLGGSYIQNGTTPQTADFNITGSGTIGSSLLVGNAGSDARLHVQTDAPGVTWTARSATQANTWRAVTFGNNLFVAVAADGTNRVMTSPDGITWTARTAAEANIWRSVTYGEGLFVAVAGSGTNRVMTSPDGITWTAQAGAEANNWQDVVHGNGLFVAISSDGTNRVMTSPDGITWTARSASEANTWFSLSYGNGLFVAVAGSGTNRVMTSPDGITWTARSTPEANTWYGLSYGNGLFVAVAADGTNRVMTSPDGITWTARAAAVANSWFAVTFGGGLFVASSYDGTNRVMTSPDGITWTARSTPEANYWYGLSYGNGLFVAVAGSGTNRVMTSGSPALRANGGVEVSGLANLRGNTVVNVQSPSAFTVQSPTNDKPLLIADTTNSNLGVGIVQPKTLMHVGVTPNAATYPAQEVNGDYYCTPGDTLSGTTCTNTTSYAATYNSGSYSCPSGGTLSGTTCTYVYAASYQSAYYYCPSGGTLSGTTCNNNYNASYQAAYYSCPNGGSLSGTTCTQSATATYSCPGGGTLQPDHTCYKEYPGKTTQTDCEAAGHNWTGFCWDSFTAQVTYSCPSGWTVSGSSCTQAATYNAGYYYCPNGGTLSGTVCYRSYAASYQSAYYYCPSGGTLSGTTCTYTYTATLTGAGYTCPDGGNLSGTTCYVYTTYVAIPGTIYYVCASPATLSGTDCIAPIISALFEGRVSIGATSITPLQYTRPAVAAGTPSFAPYTTYATGTSAYGVATGDVDGDGDIDIVTSNYSSNTVSVLKNKGNGKFATKVDYATNSGPYSVELADLDADGDLDIATANATSATLSILKNNGGGIFAAKVDYATGSSPRDLTIADIDNDGDKDVVVVNYSSNSVSVFKNNSDGTFAAKVDYTTSTGPIRLTSGDVDNDGDQDVVVSNYSVNTISVFKNNSDGTFAAKVDYTTGTGPYNIVIGDLDGDNDLDIATANNSAGTVSVLKNNSDGTFAAKVDYDNNGTAYTSIIGLSLVDIDGDSDLDILAGIGSTTASVYVLRNNGSGAGFGTSVSVALSNGYVYTIDTGDFNGDGKPDVVTANYSNSLVNVLLNDTSYPVTSTTYAADVGISSTDGDSAGLILQGTPDQQAPMLIAQDADGNPWVAINSAMSGNNLLTVGKTASNTSLSYNKPATAAGSITFAAQVAYSVGSNPYIITEADLDNDGDIDIAAANYSSNTVSILKNNGTGTFATQATYATATSPRGITTADVDADGYKDIIVTNYSSNSISVLKNNGNGTFAAKVDYTTGTQPYSVAAADLDGDGDQDVVATNYGSATMSVFLNSGTGTFAAKVDYTTGSSPYAVRLADLDKDGDQDAVVTNYTSATMSVFLNSGTGTFAAKVDYATGSAPRWLVLADLDVDGKLDVATANGGANTVSIFKGNGDGTFPAKTDYSSGISSPTGIAAADLEGDGDLDLMMSSESYYYLYSLLNNSDAVYSTGTTYSGNYYNYSLVAADFNGDGRVDMATPSTNNAAVSIFLNTTTFVTPKITYVATMGISSNSATSAGLIIQGSASQSAHLFVLQDSTGANLLTVDSTGKLQAKGTITGGVASPDYAENIGVSDRSIESADVVTMDPARPEWAIKATAPYDSSTLGVISTNPGFLTNASSVDEASAADQRPLALSGRVPVKVSTINGVIRQGDYLTSSEIPGVAMKATGPGAVIGVAMADFTGTEDSSYFCGVHTCGKVLLFINPSATNPSGQDVVMQGGSAVLSTLTVNGALHADSINTGGMLIAGALKVNGDAEMSGYLKIGGDLTVTGTTRVANIIIGKHLLSNSDVPLVAVGSAAGQDGLVTIDGTDVAGTLNITVKSRPQQGNIPAEVLNAGSLANVTFLSPYEYTPRIVVSPINQASVNAPIYLVKTVAGWQLMISQAASDGTVYQFDYVIVGSQGQTSTSP